MSDPIFNPVEGNNPFIKNLDEYKNLYEQSVNDPSKFFGHIAKQDLYWMEDFKNVHNGEFANTRWFDGGKTNISVNCIDRHLENNADKTAIIWEEMILKIAKDLLTKSFMMRCVNLQIY